MAGVHSRTGDGPAADPFLPDLGRPRHSRYEHIDLGLARLTIGSVGALVLGLIYAFVGLLVPEVPLVLGIGFGLAIAGAILSATCFIVADREGWT